MKRHYYQSTFRKLQKHFSAIVNKYDRNINLSKVEDEEAVKFVKDFEKLFDINEHCLHLETMYTYEKIKKKCTISVYISESRIIEIYHDQILFVDMLNENGGYTEYSYNKQTKKPYIVKRTSSVYEPDDNIPMEDSYDEFVTSFLLAASVENL